MEGRGYGSKSHIVRTLSKKPVQAVYAAAKGNEGLHPVPVGNRREVRCAAKVEARGKCDGLAKLKPGSVGSGRVDAVVLCPAVAPGEDEMQVHVREVRTALEGSDEGIHDGGSINVGGNTWEIGGVVVEEEPAEVHRSKAVLESDEDGLKVPDEGEVVKTEVTGKPGPCRVKSRQTEGREGREMGPDGLEEPRSRPNAVLDGQAGKGGRELPEEQRSPVIDEGLSALRIVVFGETESKGAEGPATGPGNQTKEGLKLELVRFGKKGSEGRYLAVTRAKWCVEAQMGEGPSPGKTVRNG